MWYRLAASQTAVAVSLTWLASSVCAEEQEPLIVFDSRWIPEETENLNVFVIRPDGSGPRQITFAGEGNALAHAGFPSWSRDRKQILFRGWDHRGNAQRYVVDVQSNRSEPKRVAETGLRSPDGKRMLFEREVDTDAHTKAVFVMNGDGTDPHQLTPPGLDARGGRWSPSGDEILFLSRMNRSETDIFLMLADGSNLHQLTKNQGHNQTPDWSPDGKRIVFASTRDGNLEIYAIEVDSGKARRLTNHPMADANPAYSPDGRRIVFMAERGLCLHVMDADGFNVQPLLLAKGNHADW